MRHEEPILHDDGSTAVTGRSAGDLLSEMTIEAKRLLREEVRLAKLELRDQARVAAAGAGLIGAAAAFALAGVVVLLIAAAAGLAEVMPLWGSSLIFGGFGVVLGGLLALAGLRVLRRMSAPRETMETLKEDRTWMSETMRGVRSRWRARA